MIIAQRPRINLGLVQAVRKAAFVLAIALGVTLVIFGDAQWADGHFVHEFIEWIGTVLIVLCILGRTWCTIYIGGHKNKKLVTVGPYSICRNPLYLFSILGATGVGAQLGSVVIALAAGFIAWLVFFLVVLKEEEFLISMLGNAYRNYVARVPRFLPKPSLWRDVDTLVVRPNLVLTTFVDACVFLISIPIAEGFDYLHDLGIVPVLIKLP